ncbi:MAG: hypothetical protein GF311_05260 [Candidatus Lokiarchaeota archaeon]|nr:hypothetical protein [Candidatus Lokiarchaeota archaeon]
MKKKGITVVLFIFIMVISPTVASGVLLIDPATSSSTQNSDRIFSLENSEESIDFYDSIGSIYSSETDDGIDIKVLRYHPEGELFNDGKPVLLFPGLCCNINQFLTTSTPKVIEQFGSIRLPDTLALWAQGDEKIEEDPLLYYSYAYYLWSQGYDPWFANYRGIGYGAMKSEDPHDNRVSLDDFGLYDVKAAVEKVHEITGKHPYVGGHSTGGLSPLMYLQGTEYAWTGHVRSDSQLVEERNGIKESPQTVAGFIGLDPAWIPGMTKLLDNALIWEILDFDLKINIRSLLHFLMDDIPFGADMLQCLLTLISDTYGEDISEICSYLLNLDTSNVRSDQLFFFLYYAVDTLFLRTLAHYLDFIAHDTVREFFKNGWFNERYEEPPSPGGWFDFYYYYIDNTYKMSVPSIIFLAEEENDLMDLVDGDTVIRDVIQGKTQNNYDEWYWVTGAHIDAPLGLSAPEEIFPRLGDWLALS